MKSIPIFLASDDNYAPYVCTMMFSILDNTKTKINFYVLDGGITNKSKKLIKESLKCFKHYTVEYIDMKNYGLEKFPNLRHYSLNTFSRYFIPKIKPKLGKILYMDVDIIVKGDIAELYNHDLGEYPLGAILEDFYTNNYKYLKASIYPDYKGGSNYFNAGVLLIDVQKFIQNNISQRCIDLTVEIGDKLSCADQDIFNIIFENNFKKLDYKYNYMPDHFDYLKKLHPDRAEQIRSDAVVLHYTHCKPWFYGSVADEDFWKVANRTKFFEKIKNPRKNLVKKYFKYLFLSKVYFKDCKLKKEFIKIENELYTIFIDKRIC